MNKNMTTYYFLLVDGRCREIKSDSYERALIDVCNAFAYDDYFEFLDDLNLGEWKDSEGVRHIKDYTNGTAKQFLPGYPGNEYQLKSLTKIRPTSRPKKDLTDEWEEELV